MNIITPEQGNSGGYSQKPDYGKYSYDYEYPRGLDLKPGSKLHESLKSKVHQRARDSFSIMQRRHPTWNKIDDMLTAYVPADEVEQKIQAKDSRKPISVVVPYSFASLETLLTYMVAAFFQDPIFRYEGAGPEDVTGAALMELCIDQQVRRSQGELALHTMFRDSLAYGIGPIAASWQVKQGRRVVKKQQNFASKLARFLNLSTTTKQVVPTTFYEGAKLINLDPYQILPDTNVPINDVGDGEFFGWISEEPLTRLLTEESQVDSPLFNVKYLRHLTERSTEFTTDPSRRGYRFSMNERKMIGNVTNNKTVVNMYINLIPAEWGLGNEELPQKWFFRVADSEIVIAAQPMELIHDSYPIVLAAPDFDGYSITPVSRMEMIYGLQHVLNFLFNSHIANVRRSINNMFVVDPSLINMPDFEDPSGGLLIRLRRAAFGRGVKDAIEQLGVNDVTRTNIPDAFHVIDLMNRAAASPENMMGIMRPGSERRSAAEATGTMQAAMSRMERIARMLSAQAMQPLSYLLAYHTQQLMTEETYVKIVGDWSKVLGLENGTKVVVNPLDLLVQFDVIPRDGSLPTDTNGSLAQFWNVALQTISKSPELMQSLDTTRIFLHMARLSGAKNVQEFARSQQGQPQASVMPDEEVEREAEAGNLVPMEQASAQMSPAGMLQ